MAATSANMMTAIMTTMRNMLCMSGLGRLDHVGAFHAEWIHDACVIDHVDHNRGRDDFDGCADGEELDFGGLVFGDDHVERAAFFDGLFDARSRRGRKGFDARDGHKQRGAVGRRVGRNENFADENAFGIENCGHDTCFRQRILGVRPNRVTKISVLLSLYRQTRTPGVGRIG